MLAEVLQAAGDAARPGETMTIQGAAFDANGAVSQIYLPNGSYMGSGTLTSRSATRLTRTATRAR